VDRNRIRQCSLPRGGGQVYIDPGPNGWNGPGTMRRDSKVSYPQRPAVPRGSLCFRPNRRQVRLTCRIPSIPLRHRLSLACALRRERVGRTDAGSTRTR
jgi:hypothetical protein